MHTELARIPNFERDALLVILSICRRYKKLARREDSHVLIGLFLALKVMLGHIRLNCLTSPKVVSSILLGEKSP